MDSFELNKIIAAVLMVALLIIGINKLSKGAQSDFLDYIKNIRSDIMSIFPIVQEKVPVTGHVRQWLLSK